MVSQQISVQLPNKLAAGKHRPVKVLQEVLMQIRQVKFNELEAQKFLKHELRVIYKWQQHELRVIHRLLKKTQLWMLL